MPTSARSRASSRPPRAAASRRRGSSPESIGSSRLIARHNVDFPEPDGPTTTTTSPRRTERFTSRRACSSPYHLFTRSRTTSGTGSSSSPCAWPAVVMGSNVASRYDGPPAGRRVALAARSGPCPRRKGFNMARKNPLDKIAEKALSSIKDPRSTADRVYTQAKGAGSMARQVAGRVGRAAMAKAAETAGTLAERRAARRASRRGPGLRPVPDVNEPAGPVQDFQRTAPAPSPRLLPPRARRRRRRPSPLRPPQPTWPRPSPPRPPQPTWPRPSPPRPPQPTWPRRWRRTGRPSRPPIRPRRQAAAAQEGRALQVRQEVERQEERIRREEEHRHGQEGDRVDQQEGDRVGAEEHRRVDRGEPAPASRRREPVPASRRGQRASATSAVPKDR